MKNVPYDNIKSHKKAWLYPLSRKYSFGKKSQAFLGLNLSNYYRKVNINTLCNIQGSFLMQLKIFGKIFWFSQNLITRKCEFIN